MLTRQAQKPLLRQKFLISELTISTLQRTQDLGHYLYTEISHIQTSMGSSQVGVNNE